ncbi:hypothetical protein [Paenarthrobacter ureafaciens]|uniref:hypothetical protein n=1 Tax=Paenarthrobacter ureafaciens TaxID=37931 RepID=UPI0009ACF898|nr:hypothetical protein [Paenarthrobacter ureafaciens]MEC3852001.1 hypothetical protein [Paenarthrobacter ureafaciens]GLU61255.1 hypothetical protein Pure01_37680 [Paenarthrobacter ureafaciens]GLU65544.1 hypothetical protein Pure02_37940 [Paenarthrobacter ureafaciens]GLU69663.1 hypothetical protein Pure03_36390 [Paenarthrobacter ureafaciens]GLU74085.1 hypothetical protein Pure04_38000 [Paenarthrobacter ureafaciens]
MDSQNATPEEEVGGYGTPTAEQEAGGGQAQPRVEEDLSDAGLSQDSPDGETYATGAPNLSHLDPEDSDSSGEPGAGRFGGTDEQSLQEHNLQPDAEDLPDGSGTDLPQEQAPNDDDQEDFNAG